MAYTKEDQYKKKHTHIHAHIKKLSQFGKHNRQLISSKSLKWFACGFQFPSFSIFFSSGLQCAFTE